MKRAIWIVAALLVVVVVYAAGRTRLIVPLYSSQEWESVSAVDAVRSMPRKKALESLDSTVEAIHCEAEGARALITFLDKPTRPSDRHCGGFSTANRHDPTAIFPVWLATIDPKMDGPLAKRVREHLTDAVCATHPDCTDPSRLAEHYTNSLIATADKVQRLRDMLEHAPSWRQRATLEYGLVSLEFGASHRIFEMFFKNEYLAWVGYAPAPPDQKSDVLDRLQASVDFPAVVMILRETGLGDRNHAGAPHEFAPYCTGTLVNASVILTAAHCICGADKSSESCLKSGSPVNGDLRFSGDRYRVLFQGVGVKKVSSLIVHPNYASIVRDGTAGVRKPSADIALMVLSSPVLDVKPARLAEGTAAVASQRGMFVGFGWHRRLLSDGNGDSRYADEVTMSPGAKIQDVFALWDCRDGSGLFCAKNSGAAEGAKGKAVHGATAGFCSGDSGGPFIPVPEDIWKLLKFTETSNLTPEKLLVANQQLVVEALAAGAHSYGICDARDELLLTDVRPFVPWIRREIGSLGLPDVTPGPLALEPMVNAIFGPQYLVREGSSAINGLDLLNFEQEVQLMDIPHGAQRIAITINTTCTSQAPEKCSGSSLSLALVDPSGREVRGCSAKPELTTVLECQVRREPGGWAPGFWRIRVMGYLSPRDPVHALKPLQDLQVAAVAF